MDHHISGYIKTEGRSFGATKEHVFKTDLCHFRRDVNATAHTMGTHRDVTTSYMGKAVAPVLLTEKLNVSVPMLTLYSVSEALSTTALGGQGTS